MIRLAEKEDVAVLAALEASQMEAELTPEQRGGMMSGQSFSEHELHTLVEKHWVVVAERKGKIIAYVIAGQWNFFSRWPIYRQLLRRLDNLSLEAARLTERNSCQYGPIWISPEYRGQGLFESMLVLLKQSVSQQYSYMLTFIAEDNERSFGAHTKKAAMQVLDFFEFDGRGYYLLATSTGGD